jgi:uncharacterized Ntn-hydrolase superfamily protein
VDIPEVVKKLIKKMLIFNPDNRIGSTETHLTLKKLLKKYKKQINEEAPKEDPQYLTVGNRSGGSSSDNISSSVSAFSRNTYNKNLNDSIISDIDIDIVESDYLDAKKILKEVDDSKSVRSTGRLCKEEEHKLNEFLDLDDYLQDIIKQNDPDLYNRINGIKKRKDSQANLEKKELMSIKNKPRRSNSGNLLEAITQDAKVFICFKSDKFCIEKTRA